MVTIVCRTDAPEQRVRLAKLLELTQDNQVNVVVLGLRGGAVAGQGGSVWKAPVRARRDRAGKILTAMYWMIWVFLYSLRLRHQSECIFFCIGLDAALPVFAASTINGRIRFVFDNADNASKSYQWPCGLGHVVSLFERWVANAAEVHIVPARHRWSEASRNLVVIPNRPLKRDVSYAEEIRHSWGFQLPRDRIALYVNGWLTQGRGIATLVDALKRLRLEGVPVHVIVAGRAVCKSARRLIAMEECEYRGVISHVDALALYTRAHFAFTYYDPALPINRAAEPNKWGDCLAMKVPFLANREIETVDSWLKRGVCAVFDYHDGAGLAQFLTEECREFSKWRSMREAMRVQPTEFWDAEMGKVIDELVTC